MRSFRHQTHRYIKNRLLEMYYHRSNPDHPWLTRKANEILTSYLRESDIGLEFGSGRSTVWFAGRVAHLTSIEHDPAWHGRVGRMLKEQARNNVDYRLVPMDESEENGDASSYVQTCSTIKTNSIDFVLVDGVYRDFCAFQSLRVIRPGGVLIIDNINWFLPSNSFSPSSRSIEEGPKGRVWNQVFDALYEWRAIWTSSGVTDTGFYFKPCKAQDDGGALENNR
jgi:predicted O-methyltransferase YrrM